MINRDIDEIYRDILLDPLKVCLDYLPKMGKTSGNGFNLEEFKELYGSDSLYSPIGLSSPLMYAAHKAAGGMTSIYRQLGIGCERLFRQILIDTLGLKPERANWSYEVVGTNGKTRTLALDGRIIFEDCDDGAKARVKEWCLSYARKLGVDPGKIENLEGCVFEVRQGYKSKDSKRQNADIANATKAYSSNYFPCLVVFSSQIDDDIKHRYTSEYWAIITGESSAENQVSLNSFMRSVIGFDLEAFFHRNSPFIKTEIDNILSTLLELDNIK